MFTSLLIPAAFLTALAPVYAVPARHLGAPRINYGNASAGPPLNFYLVTTTSSTLSLNSSTLPNATALSLFDPFYQENYWLRATDPGYNSLPKFNLTGGTLATVSAGPHNLGSFVFNSTVPASGKELEFFARAASGGALGLKDGYLLTVGDEVVGWKLCTKADNTYLGQTVVSTSFFFFSPRKKFVPWLHQSRDRWLTDSKFSFRGRAPTPPAPTSTCMLFLRHLIEANNFPLHFFIFSAPSIFCAEGGW